MKLITEVNHDVEYVTEEKNGKRAYHIEGVFLQANVKNRNGRVYPLEVLKREVEKYNENYVEQKRAFGELGHPDGPTINLERTSHMITDLQQDGANFMGKAKIMETPYGKIVQNLIDEGARLGVSSRGMGSLKMAKGVQQVQSDFYLSTAADIVADPSAPDAFVHGVMEGKEWVWANGIIKEADIAEYHKEIDEASSKELEAAKLKVFEDFISKL
jgi:hypothetical protein